MRPRSAARPCVTWWRWTTRGRWCCPASPAFYAGAVHIQDLVDFVAGRVLDAAGVPHKLYRRWQGELGAAAQEARATPDAGEVPPGRAHAQGTDPFMP